MKLVRLSGGLVVLAAAADGGTVTAAREDGRLVVRSRVSTPRKNLWGFRIDPAGWPEALANWTDRMMLAYHDMTQPIGLWDGPATADAEGLMLEGWVGADEPKIQSKILSGVLKRSSVAVWPLATMEDPDGTTVWTQFRIQEASIVPLGADPGVWVEPVENSEEPTTIPERAAPPRARMIPFPDVLPAAGRACGVALEAIHELAQARKVAASIGRLTSEK